MQPAQERWQLTEGMDVLSSEGDKLGKLVALTTSSIVVEKGFFFPKDYYIPRSAIASIEDDEVHLTVGKHEALHSGWDQDALAADAKLHEVGHAPGVTGAGGTSIPTTGGDPWLGTTERADLDAGIAGDDTTTPAGN